MLFDIFEYQANVNFIWIHAYGVSYAYALALCFYRIFKWTFREIEFKRIFKFIQLIVNEIVANVLVYGISNQNSVQHTLNIANNYWNEFMRTLQIF